MSEEAPDDRLPTGAVLVGVGIAMSLLLGLLGLVHHSGTTSSPGPDQAALATGVADRYLRAWQAGDRPAMVALTSGAGPQFDAAYSNFSGDLKLVALRLTHPGATVDGDFAHVPFHADADVGGLGTWSYDGALDLRLLPKPRPTDAKAKAWQVAWTPAAIHPALGPGLRLARTRSRPGRAAILDSSGRPLVGAGRPPIGTLGAVVVGRVGPADPATVAKLGPAYLAGDQVGLSGLQAAYEARLAGLPSGTVDLMGPTGVVRTLDRFEGAAPQSVRTTFDPRIQAAAEAAAAGVAKPAALVVIDAPTGEVRAVVNRPVGGFNRAMAGRYPPGSTFKVITSTALLEAGTTPASRISCPATANIGGRAFANAEAEQLGDIDFATAFAKSCNTAFVQLAEKLTPAQLVSAAEDYGFDADFGMPISAVAGKIPMPNGVVEKVADGIGQGKVTASPLQMAVVAATVASGGYHRPRIVTDEAPAPVRLLPPGVAATLQGLMRGVVERGTGTAAGLPGVAGKTGTAEFGTGNPPATHAWFIGFRGNLAFAVLVEGGGFGGAVAAPVARDFLLRVG